MFICITLLGIAVKDIIYDDIKELLEPMLITGLSPALTISLRELIANIPSLKRDVSEGSFVFFFFCFFFLISGELFDVGDKDCAKITERTSRYITKFQGHSIWHDFKLDPANFANLEIVSKDTLHVLIRINIPWGSNLAVYGRRNVVASITQYDFSHFIKSGRLHSRIKRDTLKIPQNGTDNLKTYLSILNDEDESSRPSNIPTAIEDLPIIVEDAVSVLDDTIEQRSSSSDRHIGNNGSSSSAINNATTTTMDVDEQLKISSTTHYYHANMTKRSAPAAAADGGGGGGGLRLNVTIPKYFSAGTWYLSVYNDDLNPLLIKIDRSVRF